MCTVVIYRSSNQNDAHPVLIAQNRDEYFNRPWSKPSSHWSNNPDIIAGLDLASPEKGSWLGVNKSGVFCTLVNRTGTMGKQVGKKVEVV